MPSPAFSVLVLTAVPAGLGAEPGSAFVKIDGREALLRSVELFLNRGNIKQVQVVFLPDDAEEGRRKYGGHLSFTGVKVLTGGPRWIDQAAAAVDKINPDCTHVILHDAARPAVPYSDIDALLEEAAKSPAVALAAPLRNALVEVDEGGNALAIHSATSYLQLLTPVCYSLAVYRELAQKKTEPHASKISLLKASHLNIRINNSGDATLLNNMLRMMPKPKIKGPASPFDEAQW